MLKLRLLLAVVGLLSTLSQAEIIEEKLTPWDCISTPRHYCISFDTGESAIRNGLAKMGMLHYSLIHSNSRLTFTESGWVVYCALVITKNNPNGFFLTVDENGDRWDELKMYDIELKAHYEKHRQLTRELSEYVTSEERLGRGNETLVNVAFYLNEEHIDAYLDWNGSAETWAEANRIYLEKRKEQVARVAKNVFHFATYYYPNFRSVYETFNEVSVVLARMTPNQIMQLRYERGVSAIKMVANVKEMRETLVASSDLPPPPAALAKMATEICEYTVAYACGIEPDGSRRICVEVRTLKACEDAIAAAKERHERELMERNLSTVEAARKRLAQSRDRQVRELLSKKYSIGVEYPGKPERPLIIIDPMNPISMDDAYTQILESMEQWASAPFGGALAVGTVLVRGVMRNATLLEQGFFKGTYYGKQVLQRMAEDPFHRFPELIKNWTKFGVEREIRGGDGILRKTLHIPGSYQGKEGVFEFIKNADGEIVHRLFRPTKP